MRLVAILCSIIFITGLPHQLLADDSSYDPPGKTVQLDGFRLHYLETGDDSAQKILYFHGMGSSALSWELVTDRLPQTNGIAVDIHGHGWSDYGSLANDLMQQAYDFNTLLNKEKIKGPFIVVGQSFGGLLALEFAKQYPELVSGVVLVDASHPDMMLNYRNKDGSRAWQKVRERVKQGTVIPTPVTISIDPLREMGTYPMSRDLGDDYAAYSNKTQQAMHWLYNRTYSYPKGLKSGEGVSLKHMHDHWAEYRLGSKPLVVIVAGIKSKKADTVFTEAALLKLSMDNKKDLATLSTNSRLVVAKDSGHQVHVEKPGEVVAGIQWVLSELK